MYEKVHMGMNACWAQTNKIALMCIFLNNTQCGLVRLQPLGTALIIEKDKDARGTIRSTHAHRIFIFTTHPLLKSCISNYWPLMATLHGSFALYVNVKHASIVFCRLDLEIQLFMNFATALAELPLPLSSKTYAILPPCLGGR